MSSKFIPGDLVRHQDARVVGPAGAFRVQVEFEDGSRTEWHVDYLELLERPISAGTRYRHPSSGEEYIYLDERNYWDVTLESVITDPAAVKFLTNSDAYERVAA